MTDPVEPVRDHKGLELISVNLDSKALRICARVVVASVPRPRQEIFDQGRAEKLVRTGSNHVQPQLKEIEEGQLAGAAMIPVNYAREPPIFDEQVTAPEIAVRKDSRGASERRFDIASESAQRLGPLAVAVPRDHFGIPGGRGRRRGVVTQTAQRDEKIDALLEKTRRKLERGRGAWHALLEGPLGQACRAVSKPVGNEVSDLWGRGGRFERHEGVTLMPEMLSRRADGDTQNTFLGDRHEASLSSERPSTIEPGTDLVSGLSE